jgi:ABC-type transport system involved in multi-copper enzyme maturation permease subunit
MTFLPVVERELRASTRRPWTRRSRLVFALVVAAIVALVLMFSGVAAGRGNAGGAVFRLLVFVLFGYCGVAGIFLTADALSSERREGTLGLLFLTNLRGYDVVLGKLVARALTAAYGLLAVFPILAISMLMGGVTSPEFWRIVLALSSALFLSLGLGLAVSAVQREDQPAMLVTFAILLALNGGPPLLDWWMAKLGWGVQLPTGLSPILTCLGAFDAPYRANPGTYWRGLTAIQGMGWASLLLACAVLPRIWRERGDSGARPLLWNVIRQRIRRLHGQRARFPLVGNPVTWITLRKTLLPGPALWGIVLVLLGILVLSGGGIELFVRTGPWRLGQELYGVGLQVLVVFQAGRLLVESRQSGSLELLLSTPLTTQELVAGQMEALRRRFLGPVIVGLVLNLLPGAMRLATSVRYSADTLSTAFEFILDLGFGLYGAVVLVADLYAAAWLSMMLAATIRRPARAPIWALLWVVVVPRAAFCVPRLLIDLPIIFSAQDRLRRELRALARRPFGPDRLRGGTYPTRRPASMSSREVGGS